MSAYELISNYEAVLKAFGQWPSFHDGEVHRVVLDRTRRLTSGSHYPSIELEVRGWIMTDEVTDAGYYKQEHDSVVHFLFEEVSELELDGLNHQNVLSSLDFEAVKDAQSGSVFLSVELSHCYGLSGSFKALRASVVSVAPYARGTAA
jgi:hypothetical protein